MKSKCFRCKQEIDFNTSCCFELETCPACWGSHGCDLPVGHTGEHICLMDCEFENEICVYWKICSKPTNEYCYESGSIFDFRRG